MGTLFGPTVAICGGFVLAVALIGVLSPRLGPRSFSLFVAAAAGLVPIYVLDAAWLAWQLHTTNVHVVIWVGVLQFLPFDLVKAFLAAAVCRSLAAARLQLPMSAGWR